MAKDKKKSSSSTGYTNNVGRPTGSYGSYGTSGYNGSSYNSYSRTTYSSYGTSNPQQSASQQSSADSGKKGKKAVKVERVDLPQNGKKMTGKEKKLAKKNAKFDETDLRNYPMTVGGWIGTFILLAIPLVGAICAICWFFGVGNKSRTAWARAYVVIALLVILILGIIFGVGYAVLSKKAQEAGAPKSIQGTLYYVACQVVDMFADQIGDPDAVDAVKAQIAGMLGLGSDEDNNNDGDDFSGEYQDTYDDYDAQAA